MKVLFDHPNPFWLAHGGFQTQIEQTKAALQSIGIDVEYVRWWDAEQRGDLIHFFSTASNGYLQQAKAKRIPVTMTTLFTETCNRSDLKLSLQGFFVKCILSAPIGGGIKNQLAWRSYANATHNVVGLEAEKHVLQQVYRINSNAISVVPLGLADSFLRAGRGSRSEEHLICTGTITERKCQVEIADLAKAAEVPVLFVGKPYSVNDPYWLKFQERIDQKWVKYRPHVESESEMIQLLQNSRGFVLKSLHENWCLSAHEAAACGLPVLLPDQKWSRERFGEAASYFSRSNSEQNVKILRDFYRASPTLPEPKIRIYTWTDTAQQLKGVYERLLSTSR